MSDAFIKNYNLIKRTISFVKQKQNIPPPFLSINMSLIKKLVSETAVYGLSSIVGRLLNYLLVPMFTRIFTKAEYGEVVELYAWLGVLMVFFTYRMETGFFRFGSAKEDRERTYSTISISLFTTTPILAGLLILFSTPIAAWLQYEGSSEYITWFALILAFEALSAVPFARLRLENRPWRFAFIKIVNISLNMGINFFFLLLCPYMIAKGYTSFEKIYDPNMGVGYIFIANLVASTSTLILLSPLLFKVKNQFDPALLKKIIWYALPLIVVGLASVVNELFDRITLKWLLPEAEGKEAIGVYGAVYKLAMLMSLFTQAFNYAAEPFFFSNANEKDSMTIYAQVARLFTIAGCLAFLGIVLYIDVVKYFLGEEFWEGLHVVPILLMANLSLGLYYNFAIWYKLKDKTHIGALIAIIGALITITLNILFVPAFGYTASAWATLACYGFMASAAYFVGQKYYPVPYPMLRILMLIGISLAFYLVSLSFKTLVSDVMVYVLNTVLMLGFLGVLYVLEGNWAKSVFRK